MTRPLDKIDALTEEQRHQLADWLQSHTLDQCVELVKEKLGAEIPRSTLNRFRKRVELADFLDTSPESARARAEIINAAASGKTNFSQATVDLLEKQSFELADDTRNPESVRALKDLFGLVLKHRNTSVRERMAAVHEGKLKLLQQQFELANKEDDTDAKIRDLNQKIADAFDSHPVLTAIHNAEAAAQPLSEISSESRSTSSDAGADSTPPSQLPPSESLPVIYSSAAAQDGHAQPGPINTWIHPGELPSMIKPGVSTLSPSDSQLQNSELPVPSSTLRSHAIRRWRAYIPRPCTAPDPDPSWRDECPCGLPLPCAEHPDLHLRTRYLKPSSPDYALELTQAGIICYSPTAEELGCSAELRQKAIAPFSDPRRPRTSCRSHDLALDV